MIAHVAGERYCFCGEACREGFVTDRRYGLIYGPYKLNGRYVQPSEFSLATGDCIYCGEDTQVRVKT